MIPKKISIIEVGPRDGLQNEAIPISTEAKIEFIRLLHEAGLSEIEATSFVSPKHVPQLADAAELWRHLPAGPVYSALVPNLRGLERALGVGVNRIAVFTATSETFAQKNIGMSVGDSLTVFKEMIKEFQNSGGSFVRGYVSTSFECPYEGKIDPSKVKDVAERLLELGVDEVSIGDTIGVAIPEEVKRLTEVLLKVIPIEKFAYHFHDTNGTAIANVSEAVRFGIERFDASAAGLGGCPYAPGAGGNLATDDLVYLLERSGYELGIDRLKLARASLPILTAMEKHPFAKGQLAELASFERSRRQ